MKPDLTVTTGSNDIEKLPCGCTLETSFDVDGSFRCSFFFCDDHRKVKFIKRDPKWPVLARAAVAAVARRYESFTTDEVWSELAAEGACGGDPRVIGPIMDACAADGMIARTDETICSKRRECHGRPVRVWASMVKRK